MNFTINEIVRREELTNKEWIILTKFGDYEMWRNKDDRMILEEVKENQYKVCDVYNIMDRIHRKKKECE